MPKQASKYDTNKETFIIYILLIALVNSHTYKAESLYSKFTIKVKPTTVSLVNQIGHKRLYFHVTSLWGCHLTLVPGASLFRSK